MTLFTMLLYVLTNVTPIINSNSFEQSFKVTVSDRISKLEWSHDANHTVGHFQLERSTDNKNYATIALILDGFPAENGDILYRYNDNLTKLDAGAFYYRLKEIGGDGTVSLSKRIVTQ